MTGAIHDGSVQSLIEQAAKAANSGNYALAEQFLLESSGTLQTDMLVNTELRARVYHLLANSYRDRGKLAVSREFYDKANQVFEREGYDSRPPTFFDDLYIQALWEETFDLALVAQRDLYKVLRDCSYQPFKAIARNLLRLTAIYWMQSDYPEANKYYSEYMQTAKDAGRLGTNEFVSVLCSLGLMAFRMGDSAQAESLYKRALSIAQDLQITSEKEQARILNQLGMALCEQDKHSEGQKQCKKASELRERGNSSASDTGSQFQAIADVYCSKGCLDEASKYCGAALEVFEMGCQKGRETKTESLLLIFRRLGLLDDAVILEGKTSIYAA